MRFGVACFILLAFSMQSLAGISLPQADGSSLELDAPAERLLTLSPHLAELVFAAGNDITTLTEGSYQILVTLNILKNAPEKLVHF